MIDPYDCRTMPREDLSAWRLDDDGDPVCPDCSFPDFERLDPASYSDGVTCEDCGRAAAHDGTEPPPSPPAGPARSAEADESTAASESDRHAWDCIARRVPSAQCEGLDGCEPDADDPPYHDDARAPLAARVEAWQEAHENLERAEVASVWALLEDLRRAVAGKAPKP